MGSNRIRVKSKRANIKKPDGKNSFSRIPVEIIKEIFCHVGNPYLFEMKTMCSVWYTIIQDILTLQEIQVSTERYTSAIDRFDSQCILKIYRASYKVQNIISEKVISDQMGCTISNLHGISLGYAFSELKSSVKQILYDDDDGSVDPFKDAPAIAWCSTFAITGIEYSVEQGRDNHSENARIANTLKTDYKWYAYETRSAYDSWARSIVVLYPDFKTFAVFHSFCVEPPGMYDSRLLNDYEDWTGTGSD